MSDYMCFLRSSWSQLMDNFSISAILATVVTIALDYTGAESEAVILWLVLSMTDCVLGIVRAVVLGEFSARKLHRWTWKIGTQMLIIVLFASMLRLFRIASGHELVLTNWLLCFFAFFDFSTTIDKLLSLGFPVPHFVRQLLSLMRRRIARAVAGLVGGDEADAGKLESAMRRDSKPRAKEDV